MTVDMTKLQVGDTLVLRSGETRVVHALPFGTFCGQRVVEFWLPDIAQTTWLSFNNDGGFEVVLREGVPHANDVIEIIPATPAVVAPPAPQPWPSVFDGLTERAFEKREVDLSRVTNEDLVAELARRLESFPF